jgi:hypothetical protein
MKPDLNPWPFRVLASRIALDSQGRLVLRDSGKIILPYEHFSNAVMLKHLSGPHGLHLSMEATVRSVSQNFIQNSAVFPINLFIFVGYGILHNWSR